ncbi:Profilin/allergen [Parathielavia hyrcaniae]|uniref:Profilin n=1 Tax=Parathielavia hyrcaniae TaxID=113614 RepID=A0AAN6Q524_9PEZI|nr:Profilin/allergen [Parathielavia hyrcaniae]
MSWQSYVDSSLVGSGHLDKACIISVAGDSVWAQSPDFNVQPGELLAIARALENPAPNAAADKMFAEGLWLGGERYVLARIEDRSIYARQGKIGVCIAKTKQAILIGHHSETTLFGNASQTIESLADYLIKNDY